MIIEYSAIRPVMPAKGVDACFLGYDTMPVACRMEGSVQAQKQIASAISQI